MDHGRLVQVGDVDGRHRQAPQPPVGAHEVGHERRGRVAQDLGRGVVLLQVTALGQDGDPVAHAHRLFDVMGNEHDRLAHLPLQPQELALQPVPGDGVDGPERFVHEQHRRVGGQGPGHAGPLALTA
jgi:hypothetical protein